MYGSLGRCDCTVAAAAHLGAQTKKERKKGVLFSAGGGSRAEEELETFGWFFWGAKKVGKVFVFALRACRCSQ